MSKNLRRFLFYISVVIFLLAGVVLITYAEGFKFDFTNWKFIKTGSLQLKSNVSADVYINDQMEGSTSFFGDAFTAGGLMPKSYRVKIENADYRPWQKNAEIKAGLVTDFPRIVLVPKSLIQDFVASSSLAPNFKITFDSKTDSAILTSGATIETINLNSGKTARISPTPEASVTPTPSASPILPENIILPGGKSVLSPDGQKNVWYNSHEVWVQWLRDSNYQPFMPAGAKQLITRYSGIISDVQWHKDSAHLFISVGGALDFIEIDTRGGLNSYDLATLKSTFYYSSSADAIYLFSGNKLMRINLKL